MQKPDFCHSFLLKIDQIILINAHKQEKKPYLKEKAVFSERTASMNESSCSLRVFHAAADTEELLVSINNETGSVSYRGLTGRFPVLPGFVTVTLAGARSKRIYLKKTLSLFCSVPYTAAIIQTRTRTGSAFTMRCILSGISEGFRCPARRLSGLRCSAP